MLAADPASGPVRPARRWGIFAVMLFDGARRDGD
ncbi:unannotated protein [freshwater metagenome]|uniref:Unannotated protein n=1 Tax=freshwater metagenome TaxID=449393 RepID=A0A6J6ID79_9ZZZZ